MTPEVRSKSDTAICRGRGLPKDRALAYAWYNIAAANGNSAAAQIRDRLETTMTASETARAQALAREIVDRMKPDACVLLVPDDAFP